MTDPLPTHDDVRRAAERIRAVATVTPLIESPLLNEELGGRLLVKCEMLQRTGSFKFRGAYNRISTIPEAERKGGVVAFSSGNHAQGVAAAALMLGVKAAIVMPRDAPRLKIDNTRAFGAEVVLYDRFGESRDEIAARLSRERGSTLVKPFDDPGVISGQGTIGLEIASQTKALGTVPDAVLAGCSGGGLIAGIALGLSADLPKTTVYSVEPAGLDDMARSLESGRPEKNDPAARSICDALLAPTPGDITFAIAKQRLKGGLAVTDAEVRKAMALAFRHFKIVCEPGGAVGIAAVMTGKVPTKGRTVVVVASGGNVDPLLFQEVLATA
ncbi:MAG: threonine/serine dehydratase [Alphaproteobacteria bacterium]|nr:threonine/serine dehydratase [Alphaproteobacteria bacterium]